MKFKVIQVIEAEFESDTFDKVKMFECISKKFDKCIFDPIEYDAEELITIIREDGVKLKWDKDAKEFTI